MIFHNSVYGVRCLMVTDAHTLAQQLIYPANNQPGESVTWWIVWIRLYDFDVKYIPGRINGGHVWLSWWLLGEGELEVDEEDDLEELIEASVWGIQVEQGQEWMRR